MIKRILIVVSIPITILFVMPILILSMTYNMVMFILVGKFMIDWDSFTDDVVNEYIKLNMDEKKPTP